MTVGIPCAGECADLRADRARGAGGRDLKRWIRRNSRNKRKRQDSKDAQGSERRGRGGAWMTSNLQRDHSPKRGSEV